MTYQVFPLGKRQVLARFENLADSFDKADEVIYVNIAEFATQLWKEANPSSKMSPKFEISETSLSHNQPISLIQAR